MMEVKRMADIAATKSDKVTSVLVDHYNYMCKTKLPALSSVK